MSKVTCRECRREVRRLAHHARGICINCWRRWRHASDYVPGKSRGLSDRTAEQRILDHIAVDGAGCWLWIGSQNGVGYGAAWNGQRTQLAHRQSYETFVGPIPDGLHLDHLCRVRHCVNPEHLEPVTPRENSLRSPFTQASINAAKTHCPQGHIYDEANTIRQSGGGRICRACNRARSLARYYAQKAVSA